MKRMGTQHMMRFARTASGAALVVLGSSAARGLCAQAPLGPPRSEPAAVAPARADAPGRYTTAFDVLRYDIELAIPDTARWFIGRARVRLVRKAPLPQGVTLDFTGLAVDAVQVNGTAVQWQHEADRLTVPVAAGGSDTIAVDIRYRGVPDEGLFIAPDVHGRPAAFADNWPNRARFWFPSVDHPGDKALASFTVHAPATTLQVANGTLTGEPAPTGGTVAVPDPAARRTWRWETARPIPTYTMVVGAGTMATKTIGNAACGRAPASARTDRCVEVSWWVTPNDTASAARIFGRAAQMVDFFTSYVGDFPYEKLANVQSATRFGGMENSSAIFYQGEAVARGSANFEGTVAHEIAHQWFGDSVTPADWTQLWLSEGFATYFDALFFEQADSVQRLREKMDAAKRTVLGSDVKSQPIVGPYGPDLYDILNANAYQKGAWVLHMLRGTIGDDAFKSGIQAYYREHAHGNATTDDLRRAMETASGRNLAAFFEQWVTKPGYPVFRIEQSYDAARGEATVVLTQVQEAGWPRFQLQTELELAWAGGSRREKIDVTGQRQTFTFRVPAALTQVRLDPDGWLLFAPEGGR
jgi:aminopeptidase N